MISTPFIWRVGLAKWHGESEKPSASFLGALYKKVQPKRSSNERWVRKATSQRSRGSPTEV